MFVAWHGAGMFVILAFIGALVASNLDVFFHYTRERFAEITWWPAFIVAALASWGFAVLGDRMRARPSADYWGRLFAYLGPRHTVFWIPLRVCAVLFAAAAVAFFTGTF
jgi:hypothetical protein